MKLAAFDKRILAAAILFFAANLAPGAQAQVTAASATTPIRHAYQTASYSESFRQKCSRITNIYLDNMAKRNSRSSLIKAIEAGRAEEGARRAYYTRHRVTAPDSGTRRAYQT
jgi:hypothetical protein